MVNLSECKFGDRLKTEDGKMVVFLGIEDYHGFDGICHTKYYCTMAADKTFAIMEYDNERGEVGNLPKIVCRWEDEPEKAAIPYEKTHDKPQEVKPIKAGSEAIEGQWWQRNRKNNI